MSTSTVRRASSFALLVTLSLTVVAALSTRAVIHDQERRLLTERTAEVGLVLDSSIGAISTTFASQGAILDATHESVGAYDRAAQTSVTAGPGALTFAWLRPDASGGWKVLAAAGHDLRAGQVITDARASTLSAALTRRALVASPVFGSTRTIGFAMGAPTAPAGTVLYRESVLGPVSPPLAAATAPFDELDVVIYASTAAQTAQVVKSTTAHVPLRGAVHDQPLLVGSTHWLLSVKARHPLVGTFAAAAPWLLLVGGTVGSILTAALIESAGRRRDAALALYASEHTVAETLQRSLLPQVPTLQGLEVGTRYIAAGKGQQVGGDWFDAFPLSDGSVGIAIGDVMGHDLAAASAMAQIRASLRAFAFDGGAPAMVLNRLSDLIDSFALSQLVTLVYGRIEPAATDGSRLLTFANAGHLPPLLRRADGTVRILTGGSSVLIGAPIPPDHRQVAYQINPGDTLLLFTDGLVERPGVDLDDSVAALSNQLAGLTDDPEDVAALCDRLVTLVAAELRDDIALLAVRLRPADEISNPREGSEIVGSAT